MSLPITQIGSIPHVESGNTLQIRRRFNQTVSAVNQVIQQSSTAVENSTATITTNNNGTAIANPNGYVHQFGTSSACPTGGAIGTVAVTFPVPFSGIPVVVCNADNNADGFGTSVFSCYPSSITVNGFTANFACGVIIGGSGAAGISNVVHACWEADRIG
jgi:hypothetical protein